MLVNKRLKEENTMYVFNHITVNPQLPKRIENYQKLAIIYGGLGTQNF